MESSALKIEISLLDKRGRLLFSGNWETHIDATSDEKTLLKEIKEKKSIIIPFIARSNPASQLNHLEKLGLCRQLKYSFELQGKCIEKTIALNP